MSLLSIKIVLLSWKYVALYDLKMKMPAKGKLDEFETGTVAYRFTLLELDDLEVVGSFGGVVENSEEVLYYEGSSLVVAAERDLFENFNKTVKKKLEEKYWVR